MTNERNLKLEVVCLLHRGFLNPARKESKQMGAISKSSSMQQKDTKTDWQPCRPGACMKMRVSWVGTSIWGVSIFQLSTPLGSGVAVVCKEMGCAVDLRGAFALGTHNRLIPTGNPLATNVYKIQVSSQR